MKTINIRCALMAAVLLAASGSVWADQKIKTKSNIKNDRLAESPSSTAASGQTVVDERTEASGTTDAKPASATTTIAEKVKTSEKAKTEGKVNP